MHTCTMVVTDIDGYSASLAHNLASDRLEMFCCGIKLSDRIGMHNRVIVILIMLLIVLKTMLMVLSR